MKNTKQKQNQTEIDVALKEGYISMWFYFNNLTFL